MKISVKDIAVFGMLGALMYASKWLMEVLPNIHLIGVFVVAITVVYRQKALFPIYIFVFLAGLFGGFAMWWVPYLYVWAVLWGATMLLPRNLSPKAAPFVYAAVCAAHGFLYGVLYAPAQALLFGFDVEQTVAWVIAGLPFDITHGLSNLCGGVLIYPLIKVLQKIR